MGTKIQIASDIHTEWHQDHGRSFAESMDSTDVDVLVLAGDIGNLQTLWVTIPILASKYNHIVYVVGNHEHYGTDRGTLRKSITKLCNKHPNFHWLDNDTIEIDGKVFAGTTLWFPNHPMNFSHQRKLTDFQLIPGFTKWVYQANEDAQDFLKGLVGSQVDVVVTHHAPSWESVTPTFRGSDLNRFYVTDLDRVMGYMNPSLWCHGHMHESIDYMAGDTRVVCNPFGYARQEENAGFEDRKIVEI